MLQRDGRPTALGEVIAMYGRIFTTLHILSYVDVDETYRPDIKGIRNLQEGRHALARKICHGKKSSWTTGTSAAWRTSSAPSAWS
jgi:TnpA family transposase